MEFLFVGVADLPTRLVEQAAGVRMQSSAESYPVMQVYKAQQVTGSQYHHD